MLRSTRPWTSLSAGQVVVPVKLPVALFAAMAWSLSSVGAVRAQQIGAATVLSIVDGDSIRVLQDGARITVRLACIDAPELSQRPYGERSRHYLMSRLRIGSKVRLIPKAIDRYGRTVAEVIGETNLGLAMVEDGQAFANRRYLASCHGRDYLEAEYRASRHRLGIWQEPGGITRPWEARRSRLTKVSSDDPMR